MLIYITPGSSVFDARYGSRRNSIFSAYVYIFTSICSYGPDFIRCHLSGFGSTTLVRGRFSDAFLSPSRNVLPRLSSFDRSYNRQANSIEFGYISMGASVFQDIRNNLVSQLGRRIICSLWWIRVCLVTSLLHHVLSVVFVRTLKNMMRVVAKPNITRMAGEHSICHFSAVKGFPCDTVSSLWLHLAVLRDGNCAVSLLGVSGPEPAFIRPSDVSFEPDLTCFRAVTPLVSKEGLVAVKAKTYVSGSHSATPVQSGFGQVCHGRQPVTGRSILNPTFTGLPQSGGQPDRAHWERIAAACHRLLGNRSLRTGRPGGLVKPIWHPAALSSRVNFTTVLLGMREHLFPAHAHPLGGLKGGSYFLSYLRLSLSA